MTFIKQLGIQSDTKLILDDLSAIDSEIKSMATMNQVSLRRRLNHISNPFDGIGSLWDEQRKNRVAYEKDFTEWIVNDNIYVRQEIEKLAGTVGFRIGRVRFMQLKPKCGLSVHRDAEKRYHFVLTTNPHCYFAMNNDSEFSNIKAVCYTIPQDGHWWEVDTTQTHWVYNGGNTNRIHLVVCEAP